MGYCITHNQSYEENLGGYCTYCGKPNQQKTFVTNNTNENFVNCPECGSCCIGYHNRFRCGHCNFEFNITKT